MKFSDIITKYDESRNERSLIRDYNNYMVRLGKLSSDLLNIEPNTTHYEEAEKLFIDEFTTNANNIILQECESHFEDADLINKFGDFDLDIATDRKNIKTQSDDMCSKILFSLEFESKIHGKRNEIIQTIKTKINHIISEQLVERLSQTVYEVYGTQGLNLLQLASLYDHDRVVNFLVNRCWPDKDFNNKGKPSELAPVGYIKKFLEERFNEKAEQFRL